MDASKPTDGSGLGLAIARSLAELHGGALRIRSCDGVGTIVMVHLPHEGADGIGDCVRGDALRQPPEARHCPPTCRPKRLRALPLHDPLEDRAHLLAGVLRDRVPEP